MFFFNELLSCLIVLQSTGVDFEASRACAWICESPICNQGTLHVILLADILTVICSKKMFNLYFCRVLAYERRTAVAFCTIYE